jgi:hypothetical protein
MTNNKQLTKPTRTVDSAGTEEWCLKGKLHRTDGPAVTYSDGYQEWYRNGKLHRSAGPAVVRPASEQGPSITFVEGFEMWCLDGKLHRLDGPALTHGDGSEEWWVHGVRHEPPTPSPECGGTGAILGIGYSPAGPEL